MHVPHTPPSSAQRLSSGRLISGQNLRPASRPARVLSGPGGQGEPVIEVRHRDAARTLIVIQCCCGEQIEIELQHPPGVPDASHP